MAQAEEKDESQTESPRQITPAEAEERVSSAVAEVVPEENDGLLIEEDGDPFWVIQRVFWGILKTASLLAVLLFLIWLVWRPGSFFSGNDELQFNFENDTPAETVPEEDDSQSWWQNLFAGDETVEPQVETPVNPDPDGSLLPDTNNSLDSVDIAYELETTRVLLVRGIIPDSVRWLREAKTIGDISMQILRQGTPQARSRQVEEIIAKADALFLESINLQAQLEAELDYFLTEGNAANARTAVLEQDIANALAALDPVPVEALVEEKIASQQQASFYMSNAKIRDTLLRNIQTFDRLLRQRSIPLLNPATEIRAS